MLVGFWFLFQKLNVAISSVIVVCIKRADLGSLIIMNILDMHME
mgnify:FL=1|jgi:hypothetical protein